jgi:hypothetical protein
MIVGHGLDIGRMSRVVPDGPAQSLMPGDGEEAPDGKSHLLKADGYRSQPERVNAG